MNNWCQISDKVFTYLLQRHTQDAQYGCVDAAYYLTKSEQIKNALRRIEQGEYCYYLESGEAIGIACLLVRSIAEYCTEVITIVGIK